MTMYLPLLQQQVTTPLPPGQVYSDIPEIQSYLTTAQKNPYALLSKEWYAWQACYPDYLATGSEKSPEFLACWRNYLGQPTATADISKTLSGGAAAKAEVAALEAAAEAARASQKIPWLWIIGAVVLAIIIFSMGGK